MMRKEGARNQTIRLTEGEKKIRHGGGRENNLQEKPARWYQRRSWTSSGFTEASIT